MGRNKTRFQEEGLTWALRALEGTARKGVARLLKCPQPSQAPAWTPVYMSILPLHSGQEE